MDTVSVKMVSEENESGSFEKNRDYSMESVHKQFFFTRWDVSKNEWANTVNKWYKCYMFPYRAELTKKNLVSTDPSTSE